ncbi:MAG TPA: cyclic nucleotide-binding domain-containing protein [Thermoanaerobaculia bacterium]|nr:cyclic nucleotide-binding domain-containing protein [Thermoanaerobaculia bacterium]
MPVPPQVIESAPHSSIADVLSAYETLQHVPAGKPLFREGTLPAGVWVLRAGEVELSCSSKGGDALAMQIADAGEILGLTSVVSGRAHDSTAIARTGCETGFIEKNRFLRLLEEKPGLWLTVLRMISKSINACWDCMRTLKA